VWQVLLKVTSVHGPVSILEHPLTFFGAFIPLPVVDCAISPLTQPLSSHLAFDPLTLILPALHRADEQALPLLETVDVLPFVDVSILPFSYASAIGKTILELPQVNFTLAENQFTPAMHGTLLPVALVNFTFLGLRPVLLTKTVLLALH